MQRVFISFDYDNDAELKNALVGQAKYPNSPFEIADWSVKEPFSGNWQAKVQERMKRTSVVVVMCGHRTTHRAGGCSGGQDRSTTRQAVLPAGGQESRQQHEADNGRAEGQDVQLEVGQSSGVASGTSVGFQPAM